MKIIRHKTRKVKIKDLIISSSNPVAVESMINADAHNISKIIKQINQLERAGCMLVRISLPDIVSAKLVSKIKEKVNVPLMGDIHFDYRIAMEAIHQGIDSIRLNPGNIQKEKIKLLVEKVKEQNIAVRVGANTGSINRTKYKKNNANALINCVMEHIRIFEKAKYYNLIVSLKSSDVLTTIEAYQKFSKIRDYPLHIGITEAGTKFSGTIKSAAGLGVLLYQGLGDTIRVSLSCDPVEEVYVGYKILQSMGLYNNMVDIISCPTCARACINVEKIANIIEKKTRALKKPIKIAVMGCIVNGPGEAKDADIGVAGSKSEAILFKKGNFVKKINRDKIIMELLEFIENETLT